MQRAQCREHRLGAFVAEPGTADPARGDVDQRQRVQERPGASPAAVSYQVNFDKARNRLMPVGEALDRDLMLEQRARLRRADAAFGQTSSRRGERAIDG